MNKFLLGLSVTLGATLAIALALVSTPVNASVIQGSEYQSTTTTSAFAAVGVKQLTQGAGSVLGSVIIASSSPVVQPYTLTVYDATSTMATTTARILARFGSNNQTHGTYTFDSVAFYGVTIETPVGFNGNYTITYR